MEKCQIRSYIKTRVILGITPIEIWKELEIAYPGQAPSYRCVAKWAALFKDGRQRVEDDPRSGRPITALTCQNIELVRRIIEDDPHATYDIIEAQAGLSRGTICTINDSTEKIASRWISYELTNENREERVNACRENLAMFKEGK